MNLNRSLDKICRIGFDKESDIIKQKLIYICNAYCLLVCITCFVMASLMLLFSGEMIWASFVYAVGIVFLFLELPIITAKVHTLVM